MAAKDNYTHFKVKDAHGADFYCPRDAVEEKTAVSHQDLDECVEKDVTERYSGNIDVNPLNGKEHTMSDVEPKTLCALQEEGYIESHTDLFKKLIQPAGFFCKNCGRSAVSQDNLCNPESLS